LHWDGKEWKIVPTPNPGAGANFLDGVVALAPNDAWAVGDSGTSAGPRSLLLHWDGTTWTQGKLPEIPVAGHALYALSAVAPNDIWAAGVFGDQNSSGGLVLHYDGANWGVQQTFTFPPASSILYNVVARSANDVWAVGAVQIPRSVKDLQMHWDGKSWERVDTSIDVEPVFLREAWDVTFAPGSNARWVVGNFGSRPGILHYDGEKRERSGVDLRQAEDTYLKGAVAASNTEAWAVGYSIAKQKKTPLIAHTTNGSDWSEVVGPISEGDVALYDVIAVPGVSREYLAVGEANGSTLIEAYRDLCAPTPPTVSPTSPPSTSTPSTAPTFAPTPIPGEAQSSRTFPETGKMVKGIFLEYWDKHGGLPQQGFPISEMFTEVSTLDGKPYTVQYFERAVFEYHPENQPPFNVLLSQLGTFRYKQKYPGGAGAPNQQPNTSAGSVLFPETGKRVGGKFLEYWQKNGGLAQQGYPISEEFTEKSDLDGKEYRVQYFERAVFEMHPEHQPPYDVLLSQLGTFQHKQKYGGR
jgi:hypothetical protein